MRTLERVARSLMAGIVVALVVAPATRAQDPAAPGASPAGGPWRGLYVGGGGTYSNVSVTVDGGSCYYDYDCDWWGDYSNYDSGDGAFGYALHAGVRVYKYLAFEVGYLDPGSIGWDKDLVYMPEFNDYYNNRVDFDARVTEVSILGIFPLDDVFELYVRAGAGFWDGHSTQRLDESFGDTIIDREIDEDGTGLLLGVGAGFTFARGLHLRLDLQTVGIDEDVLSAREDTSLDSVLLEIQYRFGAP